MPPRVAARKAIDKENDENATHTRVTRAKAAALTTDSTTDGLKKTLVRSKSTTTTTVGALQSRKRAALGDVSNVAKNEPAANEKDGKKALTSKTTITSKVAQPSKIQKPIRTASTRSVLTVKEKNASDLKRPADSTTAPASKKRGAGSSSSTITQKSTVEEDDLAATENVAPAQKKVKLSPKKSAPVSRIPVEAPAAQLHLSPLEPAVFEDEAGPQLPPGVEDLDAEDQFDPLMVSEYVNEIYDYMKELEIRTMANPNYMENQSELEWKMRGILVDWLLEVHTRFRLLPETLFLAVNIIDRFLSCKIVQLDRLQLVGVTAMFIASKYEEVLSPHVQNFRHVADDGFTEEEILQAEKFVLQALDYDLSYPNPMNFLRRISKADNYDVQTRTFGKYLLEISCLDHRFIEYPPSQVAAAAMYLARLVNESGEWDPTLAYYAGYTEDELMPVFLLMLDYLSGPVTHDAFFKKYASKKFLKASMVIRSWAKVNAPQWLATEAAPAPLSRSDSHKAR